MLPYLLDAGGQHNRASLDQRSVIAVEVVLSEFGPDGGIEHRPSRCRRFLRVRRLAGHKRGRAPGKHRQPRKSHRPHIYFVSTFTTSITRLFGTSI